MPFEHFNPVQAAVADIAFQDDSNMLVSAPTGCGKTAIFDLALLRTVSAGNAAKVLYLAPMKALCQERLEDWRERGKTLKLNVMLLTGDVDWATSAMQQLRAAHVVVATPEKFDSFTRSWRDNVQLLASFGCICVDEVHSVGEERGPSLEAVIARMHLLHDMELVRRNAWPAANLRICAVSATIGNPQCLARWLRVHPDNVLVAGDHLRPVPLTVHVQGARLHSNAFLNEQLLIKNYVPSVVREYSEGKPTLVFCATKRGAENCAHRLATELAGQLVLSAEHRAALAGAAKRIDNAKLAQAVVRGTAFHTGELIAADRAVVEKLYRQGFLGVVSATTTLSLGVNLPAHLVVIAGTQQYKGAELGYRSYPASLVLQMMGRAGRPGADTHGVAVILTDDASVPHWTSVQHGVVEPRSRMLDEQAVFRHLNAEIAAGTVADLRGASTWWQGTLGFQQAGQACKANSATPFAAEQLGTQLGSDAFVRHAAQSLVQAGCALGQAGHTPQLRLTADTALRPSMLGRIAGSQYMHTSTLHTVLAWCCDGSVHADDPAPRGPVLAQAMASLHTAAGADTRGFEWASVVWALLEGRAPSAAARHMLAQLVQHSSVRHLAWLVCHTRDVWQAAPIRQGDKSTLNEWNKKLSMTLGQAALSGLQAGDTPAKRTRVAAGKVKHAAHKAFVLLQVLLDRQPGLGMSERAEAQAVSVATARVAAACERLAQALPAPGNVLAARFAELARCAHVQAWTDTQYPLLQLLRIGQANCAKLAEAGIISLQDLQGASDQALRAALGGGLPRWAQDARARLASTPRLELSPPSVSVAGEQVTLGLEAECADGAIPGTRSGTRRFWRPWKVLAWALGSAGLLLRKFADASGGAWNMTVPVSAFQAGKLELHVMLLHTELVGTDVHRSYLVQLPDQAPRVAIEPTSVVPSGTAPAAAPAPAPAAVNEPKNPPPSAAARAAVPSAERAADVAEPRSHDSDGASQLSFASDRGRCARHAPVMPAAETAEQRNEASHSPLHVLTLTARSSRLVPTFQLESSQSSSSDATTQACSPARPSAAQSGPDAPASPAQAPASPVHSTPLKLPAAQLTPTLQSTLTAQQSLSPWLSQAAKSQSKLLPPSPQVMSQATHLGMAPGTPARPHISSTAGQSFARAEPLQRAPQAGPASGLPESAPRSFAQWTPAPAKLGHHSLWRRQAAGIKRPRTTLGLVALSQASRWSADTASQAEHPSSAGRHAPRPSLATRPMPSIVPGAVPSHKDVQAQLDAQLQALLWQ